MAPLCAAPQICNTCCAVFMQTAVVDRTSSHSGIYLVGDLFRCSAYAKLGMISSALSSTSDDVTKLLNVSLDLIAPTDKNTNMPATAAASKSDNKSGGLSAGVSGVLLGSSKGGAASAVEKAGDTERAVEVLSFLVSKTKVMRHIHHQRVMPGRGLIGMGQSKTCRQNIRHGRKRS